MWLELDWLCFSLRHFANHDLSVTCLRELQLISKLCKGGNYNWTLNKATNEGDFRISRAKV
jgi:hypothetical protein